MRFQTVLFAIVFSVFGSTSWAATVYNCGLDQKVLNWIPPTLVVSHIPGSNIAQVSDRVVRFYFKKPKSARVVHDNDRRITFAWSVRITDKNGLRAEMLYRATYLKASGDMKIFAKPAGFSNNFSSSGSCKLSKGRQLRS